MPLFLFDFVLLKSPNLITHDRPQTIIYYLSENIAFGDVFTICDEVVTCV